MSGLVALVGVVSALIAALVVARMQGPRGGPALLNTATVLQRIQSLAQLVTVKYVLEKIVILEDPKYLGGLIPLGQNRIVLLAHGQVKAGVDFSEVHAEDLEVSGRRIVVTLPRAIVTDAYLVEQRTQVLDYRTGLLAPFDKTLEQTARRQALLEITRAARQNGIEEEAAEQARKQLTRLLEAGGFEAVEIRLRSPQR